MRIFERMSTVLRVPLQWVGPIVMRCGFGQPLEEIDIPLATFETPLWPSVGRGAKVSRLIQGLTALVLNDVMTRSVLVRAVSAAKGLELLKVWQSDARIPSVAQATSRFVEFLGIEGTILGQSIFLRLSFDTKKAAGHNMVTKAADAVLSYLVQNYPVDHVSVSGNMCVDKKVSAINSLKGRGKHVIVEGLIPEDICQSCLKTTPRALHDLNIRKNYLGSIAAGSLCSANAHYANMLLAFYLATGQDAANIIEGSQGITTTDLILDEKGQDVLHFSVHLPNVIVGVIGNGKKEADIQDTLNRLPLKGKKEDPHSQSQRLAMMMGAGVWCGEVSLLAAQTNPGELMRSHLHLERKKEPQ